MLCFGACRVIIFMGCHVVPYRQMGECRPRTLGGVEKALRQEVVRRLFSSHPGITLPTISTSSMGLGCLKSSLWTCQGYVRRPPEKRSWRVMSRPLEQIETCFSVGGGTSALTRDDFFSRCAHFFQEQLLSALERPASVQLQLKATGRYKRETLARSKLRCEF